jgi:DNA-binding transcriptional LysR family regulator
VNYTSLRYFVEVADCRSIRQAADRLHVAPSAVSRQIANLEHDLGAELIERGPGGTKLTAAGKIVAERSRSTFREFERIRALVDDLKGLRRGRIDIFCIEGLISDFLPKAIADFHRLYPQIDYRLVTAPTDRTIEAIAADECDIGITINAEPRADIKVVCSRSEKLHAIVASTHPLADKRSLSLIEAAEHPLALLLPSFGVRQLLDNQFARHDLTPRQFLTSNSVAAVKAVVSEGLAVGFMSPTLIRRELSNGELCARPITPAPLHAYRLELCVHSQRHLSFAASKMLGFLRNSLMPGGQ